MESVTQEDLRPFDALQEPSVVPPIFPCTCPVMLLINQYSGWDEREMSLSEQPTKLQGQGAHSYSLIFSHRRNHRLKRSLLALSSAVLGWGDTEQVALTHSSASYVFVLVVC